MRGIGLLVLAIGVLVACAPGSAQTGSATSLTVTLWADGVGKGEPVRTTLRCNPPRGTVPRPAVACRRLAETGRKLFAPPREDLVCTQVYGGPQVARVTGTVQGKRVWATFSRQDGCQISRWDALAPWLLPRGGAAS